MSTSYSRLLLDVKLLSDILNKKREAIPLEERKRRKREEIRATRDWDLKYVRVFLPNGEFEYRPRDQSLSAEWLGDQEL